MTNTVTETIGQPGVHGLLQELAVYPDPGMWALDTYNPVARLKVAGRHVSYDGSGNPVYDLDALQADLQAFKDYTDTFGGVPGIPGPREGATLATGWADIAAVLGVTLS